MSLTIKVPLELERRLQAAAEEHGQDLSDYVRPALDALAMTSVEKGDELPSYLQSFMEAANALPDEVLERLPRDASRNLDHYLYSAPLTNASKK